MRRELCGAACHVCRYERRDRAVQMAESTDPPRKPGQNLFPAFRTGRSQRTRQPFRVLSNRSRSRPSPRNGAAHQRGWSRATAIVAFAFTCAAAKLGGCGWRGSDHSVRSGICCRRLLARGKRARAHRARDRNGPLSAQRRTWTVAPLTVLFSTLSVAALITMVPLLNAVGSGAGFACSQTARQLGSSPLAQWQS